MKLLYIFPEELSGRYAREYHVYRLAESLAAAGCEVILAAAPSEKITSAQQLHAFFGGTQSARLRVEWLKRKIELGPLKIRSGAWFFRQLDALIKSVKPDAVYTMHLKAADHVAKKHPALPLVFEAHEIFADTYAEGTTKHRELLELERRVYGHVRAVVTISAYLGECLRTRFGVSVPMRAQHDGIDEAMLLDLATPPDPHELIYAGSLQPWKGVLFAVLAMAELSEFHLTVLGGEGRPLEVLRKGAPKNVTFHGQVSREAMRPFLQKASIGLIPNLLEPRSALYTFPLKLLEYSAAGKGIVASRIPVFDQVDINGWVNLVPSGDVAALAQGVRSLAAREINRGAAQGWARQYLWPEQGIALKPFLENAL